MGECIHGNVFFCFKCEALRKAAEEEEEGDEPPS